MRVIYIIWRRFILLIIFWGVILILFTEKDLQIRVDDVDVLLQALDDVPNHVIGEPLSFLLPLGLLLF